jgi:hypothetical protein
VLAPVAIYGTLAIELSLPILMLVRKTRLLGVLIGLVFSLGMILQGVSDFPVLIVALYPTFLSLAQARESVDRCRTRPRIARLIAAAIFAASWFTQRQPRANWMYANGSLPTSLMEIYSVVAFTSFVLLVYVAVTMAEWLLVRGPAFPNAEERRARSLQSAAGSSSRRWVARAAVFLVSIALVYDHLAGYFALPAAGPMIMFSGISADLSNHFLLPRTALSQSYDYVSVVRFESTDRKNEAAQEFRSFTKWLAHREPQPYELNLNEVRYQMNRICSSTNKPTVQITLRTRGDETLDFNDVCATPGMLWYLPLPVASTCNPNCDDEVALRASGSLVERGGGGVAELNQLMKAAPDFFRPHNPTPQTKSP